MTMNTMELDGYTAVIRYNPETDSFRGEIQGLNGGADSARPSRDCCPGRWHQSQALVEKAVHHELEAG